MRLERRFFARDAAVVAKELLGTRLVHAVDGVRLEGVVVETEAYCGPLDRACHARFGRTKAREHLFAGPGTAYVFLVYGMHLCFNVTCLREGAGHAVLVRAVETASGKGDGPGRVARVMRLERGHGGEDLVVSPRLFFERTQRRARVGAIGVSARVGVAYAGEDARLPLRFFDAESRGVSRPPKGAIGLGDKRSD